jgi:hypothetical protein
MPADTKRFVPSGSLKKINITLEDTIEVRPRIMSELFFDFNTFIWLDVAVCLIDKIRFI